MNRGAVASRLLPAALFFFSLGLYANSLSNGFALDDAVAIGKNTLIQSLGNLPSLWTSNYWAPYLDAGLYRPVVTTSYALNHALGALDPFGYHALNVLLNALVSVLVLLLYRALTDDALAATLAAFFYAAHAIHTEAVANVVGRAELLAAAFLLGALLAYIRARGGGGGRFFAASGALYLLALLCKENTITFLGVLVLYDFSFGDGDAARRVRDGVRRYGGYLGVTAVYLVARWLVLRGGDPVRIGPLDNPLAVLETPWLELNALHAGLRYLGLLFAPLGLSHDYSVGAIELIESSADLRWLAVLLGSGVALASLPLAYRVSRPLFFALGFAFVTYSVTSNLLLTIGTMLGERLMYLPSVGFCLAVVLAGRLLLERLPLSRRAANVSLCVFFGAVIAANGWRSVERNRDWRSDAELIASALDRDSGGAKVHYNAAWTRYVEEADFEGAARHARRAVETWPGYAKAWAVLGHSLVRLGRRDEAADAYEQAARFDLGDPGVYNNLGYMLLQRGGEDERAVELIEKAVKLEPDNPSYLDSLGWAYFQTRTGGLREARDLIARSLEIDDSGPSGATRRAHLAEVEAALRARAL